MTQQQSPMKTSSRKLPPLTLLAIVCASISTATLAQGKIEEVIVTAQKRDERLSEVPLSVVAQTGAQLEAAGIINTRDLAQIVPGLTFSSQGAWSQPAIRGVSSTTTNAGAESAVAIYLDGIYQPSQNGQIYDLPDISQIEVLKGPQGTLFGRNATAGAIQIFTRDPSFDSALEVKTSLGMFTGNTGERAAHYGVKVFATAPLVDDVLAGSLSGYVDRNEGYLDNLVTGDNDGEVRSSMIRGKLLWQANDDVRFVLTGMYSERDDDATEAGSVSTGQSAGAAVPGAIVPTKPLTVAYDTPKPSYEAEAWAVTLRGDIDTDAGSFTTLTGYNHLKSDIAVDVDGTYVSTDPATRLLACPGCTSYLVETPNESFSQEVDFTSENFGIFSITTGLNYFWAEGEQSGNANTEAGGPALFRYFYTNIVETEAYAAFAELTAEATDELTFIGGVRYNEETKTGRTGLFGAHPEEYDEQVYRSWTPRASVRYSFTNDLNAYFTFSKGFKSGVLQETDPTAPAADPEKLTAYEIGVKYVGADASINVSYFHYDYEDLQVLLFEGVTSQTQNAATAKIDGFDIDGIYALTDALTWRAGVSWIPRADFTSYPDAGVYVPVAPGSPLLTPDSIDAGGTRMPRAPKLTVSSGIDYSETVGGGELTGNLTAYYSSEYRWEVTNRLRTGSYFTLNGRLAYQPEGSAFRYGLYGKNLTDRAYIQGTLSSGSSDLSFYAPPREVGVTLDMSF